MTELRFGFPGKNYALKEKKRGFTMRIDSAMKLIGHDRDNFTYRHVMAHSSQDRTVRRTESDYVQAKESEQNLSKEDWERLQDKIETGRYSARINPEEGSIEISNPYTNTWEFYNPNLMVIDDN